MNRIVLRRKIFDWTAIAFAGFATLFGLFWLAWILWTTVSQGLAALSPAILTEMTPPPGHDGGLANAFYGSAVMVLLGKRVWWLPAWMEKLVPHISIEGEEYFAARDAAGKGTMTPVPEPALETADGGE